MVHSRLFGYVAEHWDYLGIIAAGIIASPSAEIWLLILKLRTKFIDFYYHMESIELNPPWMLKFFAGCCDV